MCRVYLSRAKISRDHYRMEMYYVYVLESLKDKSLYIGSTSDLKKRLREHNSGKSRYTNQHKPYKTVCYVALPTKSDAERFEKYLKSGYGRKTLRKMLKDYFENRQDTPEI